MSNIEIGALFEKVKECKNAIIVGHSHPDGDCVGTAVALSVLVEALGGKAEIIFPEKAPRRLEFILGEHRELDALPENLDSYQIICVDVASPVQMASLREKIENRVFIRIDHHDVGVPYAQNEFVDATAAATAEIIFSLFEYARATGHFENEEIPFACRTPLYAAISSDTGCFKYANVTPVTHLAAAALIKSGINAAEINRLLFDTKDARQLKAEGIAINRIETFENGEISGIAIELSDYGEELNVKDFETAIDFARCVRGARVAVCVKAAPVENTFRASLRANDDTDVSKIAALFGGGGHIRAAGCTIHADSAKEALLMIVNEIKKVL